MLICILHQCAKKNIVSKCTKFSRLHFQMHQIIVKITQILNSQLFISKKVPTYLCISLRCKHCLLNSKRHQKSFLCAVCTLFSRSMKLRHTSTITNKITAKFCTRFDSSVDYSVCYDIKAPYKYINRSSLSDSDRV